MTLFEDRERAAEYGFTHAEELRFFATRDGIEALAFWAASGLNLAGDARSSYVQDAVNRFVCGRGRGHVDCVSQGRSRTSREARSRPGCRYRLPAIRRLGSRSSAWTLPEDGRVRDRAARH